MTELFDIERTGKVRGWQVTGRAVIALCCRALVPAVALIVAKRGNTGSVRFALNAARNRPCGGD